MVIIYAAMLAGCDDPALTAASGGNPELQAANARATLNAANIIAGQTQQAGEAIRAQATIYAAQTADAQNAIQATERARETETARMATVHAQAVQATQQAQATSTQGAIYAAQTQTAFPPTAEARRATATAVQAAMIREERRLFWEQFTTPVWVLCPGIAAAVLAGIILLGLFKLWPQIRGLVQAMEMRARTIVTPDGEIVGYLPDGYQARVIQPKRNFGAALNITADGVEVSALAPDLDMQNQTVARHQASILADHMPRGSQKATQKLIGTPRSGAPQVRVINNPNELPPGVVTPDVLKALEAKWRDAE